MQLAPAVPHEWSTARGTLGLDRPIVVGVLNVTPDSFWDGGRHAGVEAAVRHAAQLLEAGADVLDVGGESTRPGAAPVAVSAEIARVEPVVRAISSRWPAAVVSVDTVKAAVARAALDAGAAIINDVSALRLDPALAAVVVSHGAGLVLMHSRGGVDRMADYQLAVYGTDVVGTVCAELTAAVDRARAAGVENTAIVVDPGLGFSKRTEHSLALIAQLSRVVALGYPVLVGPSRKRFVGEAVGGLPVENRLEGTIAACVMALAGGARLFRVHDVAEVRRALDLAEAIRRTPG
jgi:dihydropteroate synthase